VTAKVTPTRDGYGYSCRECKSRASGWQLRTLAQHAADTHNMQAHEHELQAQADAAGIVWLEREGKGRIPPGAFTLWASPLCGHGRKLHRARRFDTCLDCGYALHKLTGEVLDRGQVS
jgi:hypothetical protein